MAKITLKRVRLINWYGYTDETIPFSDDLTLITGDNGTGKSVILDAIKYAYIGDTNFNKASEGDDNRTLKGYTRCLLNVTENTWGRDVSTYPVVYTHIALEFENPDHSLFTLGVILTTAGDNNPESDWYEAADRGLDDLKFITLKDGNRMVLSPKNFQMTNRVELLNKASAMSTFSIRTGLNLKDEGIRDYGRKLRNLISYNPKMKLNDFIKTSVLAEHNADLRKLKSEKKSIDALSENFARIQRDLNALDLVLKDFDDYSRTSARLQIDKVKIDYRDLVQTKTLTDEKKRALSAVEARINTLNQRQSENEMNLTRERKVLEDLRVRLDKVDGAGELKSAENELEDLKDKEAQLNLLKSELAEQEDKYEEMLKEIQHEKRSVDEKTETVIHGFLDTKFTSDEKQRAAVTLRDTVTDILHQLISQETTLSHALRDCSDQISQLEEEIRTYEKGLPDYHRIEREKKLCDEINAYFRIHDINSEAHLAFEYVTSLKDARWQDAIECYLRSHRYAVIVDPQYFDIADEIHDRTEYRYTSLVNTPLLMKNQREPLADSVFQILEVKNPWARKFFAFFLGGIHAVTKDQVASFESAMSYEGKLSRNMEITWLNFKKTGPYYLGEEAVRRNRDLAQDNLKTCRADQDRLEKEKDMCSRRVDIYQSMLKHFERVDYDAPRRFLENAARIEETQKKVNVLKQALKNNQEFVVLKEQESKEEKKINTLESINKELSHKISSCAVQQGSLRTDLNAADQKANLLQEKIDAASLQYPAETKQAVKEYDLFVHGKTGGSDAPKQERIQRLNGTLNVLQGQLFTHQADYNHLVDPSSALPQGIDQEKVYRERRNRIAMDDLEGVQAKMADEKRNYETIFKNQFILEIYNHAEEALGSLRKINRELEHFPYEIKYRFRVSEIQDSSDYGKIMRFGKLLEQLSEDDSVRNVSLFSSSSFPEEEYQQLSKEVEKIVEKIVSDPTEESIIRFADYRNYLRYEIEYENQYGQTGDLSRQMGYNSGAEKQIPYTLILVAALSMLYNNGSDTVRLAFIDEPFGKMSPSNVRIMTDFFRRQNFQTIFISASHLDDIGDACGTIIPVIRYGEADMRIGAIRFKDGGDHKDAV